MKKVLIPVITVFLSFLISGTKAQSKKLSIEKEPSWVTINNINYINSKQEGEAEDGCYDVAYEKQVCLTEQAKYYKKTLKILSETGVENNSEVSIDFDPSYQGLILHRVQVIRDGVSINKLELAKFKTIQQESDLSAHLYNGTLTALLLLEDVRKGDVIEYSYTIKGSNPIFNNRYCDLFDTRFTVPLGNIYYKVVTPANKKINIKCTGGTVNPAIKQTQNGTEYEWRLTEIAPLRVDKRIPSWYDPFPMILISEYDSWNEVNKWAASLFPANVSLSAGLQKKIDNIRNTNASNEARTLAALHFVQDEIRYMGIEMGVGSHKPGHPNKIFTQRFGDCKDKSYLLVSMLRALGIEASPVLINTAYKKTINNWLPSHSAFDHVTVRAKVDGQIYFFDPTISLQRGSLKDIVYPDYQTGLVITDTTPSLVAIPAHDQGMVKVKEIFNIPDMTGKAQLKVITYYTGAFADDNRNDFSKTSLYKIKKKYRDFYANYFEKIIADSITYKDDCSTGKFITTEYYTITDLWKTEKGVTLSSSSFAPYIINSVLLQPDDQKRTMPYSLRYPARYSEDVEINLPQEWPVDIKDFTIECGYFRLNSNATYSDKKITLHYDYENFKDNIPANEMENYLFNYKSTEKICRGWDLKTNNSLYSNAAEFPGISGTSAGNIFPKLYFLLALSIIITAVVKHQKKQREY